MARKCAPTLPSTLLRGWWWSAGLLVPKIDTLLPFSDDAAVRIPTDKRAPPAPEVSRIPPDDLRGSGRASAAAASAERRRSSGAEVSGERRPCAKASWARTPPDAGAVSWRRGVSPGLLLLALPDAKDGLIGSPMAQALPASGLGVWGDRLPVLAWAKPAHPLSPCTWVLSNEKWACRPFPFLCGGGTGTPPVKPMLSTACACETASIELRSESASASAPYNIRRETRGEICSCQYTARCRMRAAQNQ